MHCDHCGEALPKPKRGQPQRFCTAKCRVAASRQSLCVTEPAPPIPVTPMRNTVPTDAPAAPEPPSHGWGKVGDPILIGDDYPLEYYEDGFPKLPACLGRRTNRGLRNEQAETV